jgi:uncharacterized phage protein gp47/JayE
MAATTQQIIDQMVAQARALDPAFSFEVGTPERNLFEAVASVIAQASVDFDVLDAQHDIDTMTGSRLDSFLSNFGFGRQQPTRATGTVTFSRLTTSSADITIPRGTQVVARQGTVGFTAIVFATTETVVLQSGKTDIDAAIECTLPGTVGNLPALSITGFAGPQQVPGISGVSNPSPTNGGIDGETDADLKVRFKNTVFRNQSGTLDQFLALAVSTPYTFKANVVGPISRYLEYIQVPQNTVDGGPGDDSMQIDPIIDPNGTSFPHKRSTAVSTIPYSKFTYDGNMYLSNGGIGTDQTFYRQNVDFVFNNPAKGDGDAVFGSNVQDSATAIDQCKPNITILNPDFGATPTTGLAPGDVLLLEHAYISKNSRNDYRRGILNCIDIFIDGKNSVPVISSEVMPGAANDIVESPQTVMAYRGNYRRVLDYSLPETHNRLQILYWQPTLDVPDTIDIGTNRYFKAKFVTRDLAGAAHYWADADATQPAHYWMVQDVSELFGTVRARNGIEWSYSVPGIPLDTTPDVPGVPRVATDWTGTQFTITNYYYDQNVGDLQAIMEKNKQITTDVLVHEARIRNFKLYITLMYSPGANATAVNANIAGAVSTFFASQYFGTVIQMSDLLQVVHNVPGVDNVRWSSELDGTLPKVEEVQPNGSSLVPAVTYDADFFLQDNELPALPAVTAIDVSPALVIKVRAQNTWKRITN